MLRGYFNDHMGEKVYVVIKLQHRDRDIFREKEVYTALQDKAARIGVSTGCVYMFPSPPEYLTLEDFGTDIRTYFHPESIVLVSNLKKMIGALKSVHSLGYAHCDIKPSNIAIREDKYHKGVFDFKFIDFDSATPIGELYHSLGKFTWSWVSPEMYFHGLSQEPLVVTEAIDVFGMGLIVGAFLDPHCNPDMAILPDDEASLRRVLQEQGELYKLLPCSLKPSYRPAVHMACR